MPRGIYVKAQVRTLLCMSPHFLCFIKLSFGVARPGQEGSKDQNIEYTLTDTFTIIPFKTLKSAKSK